MPITEKARTGDGKHLVGWDSDLQDWVPLDEEAESGSFLGNVARAAGRGTEEIGQGLQELLIPENEGQRLRGEELRGRQQAASRSAPLAEAIGGAAPDVLAGVAAAPFTGGMSLPATLGVEAGAGGLMGMLRPGSIEQRIGNMALGATAAVGGVAVGHVAAAGVGGALKVFDRLSKQSLSRIGAEAEQAAGRVAQARQRVTLEDVQAEEAALAGGRSAGAAETPEEMIEPRLREESDVLARTEDVGASTIDDRQVQLMRERGERLGMRESLSFGSRGGSPIRRARAHLNLTPLGDPIEQSIKAQNQGKVANYLAKALELPDADKRTSIFADNIDDARAIIGRKFEYVQERMPSVQHDDLVKAMNAVSQRAGPGGKLAGQKEIQAIIDDVPQGGKWDGDQIMQTRSRLSGRMADFFNAGDTSSGEAVMKAISKMDDMLAKRMRKEGKDKLAKFWEQSRRQWQILSYVDRPGAVNLATGDVNARTVFNQMRKRPSSGGIGQRPEMGTPERDLYDALEFQMHNETGEPMTGARALMKSAPVAAGMGAGIVYGGLNTLGGIFDQ